ncbi:MAG: ComF family protein [Anaerolineae bacterium]|nr:ComF family protein [Anaerolineae bacterium]
MQQPGAAQTHQGVSAFTNGWMLLKQHILLPALDLVFPPACVGCGRVGTQMCPECQATLTREPIIQQDPLPPLLAVGALGAFDGVVQAAVHALKYDHITALADLLGELLAELIRWDGWPQAIIVPVPLHPSRLQQRGFNQAALLGRAIACELNWPYDEHLLRRVRQTASQVGLGYHDRQVNVRDAFSVEHPDRVQGASFLLVDDVYTTGATLHECAVCLAEQGASAVRAVVVGRAGFAGG